VRAFSSWDVGVLGGGIEAVGVGEVWPLLAVMGSQESTMLLPMRQYVDSETRSCVRAVLRRGIVGSL
jgi:hypothetical protein